jgi:hypothetical protein
MNRIAVLLSGDLFLTILLSCCFLRWRAAHAYSRSLSQWLPASDAQ